MAEKRQTQLTSLDLWVRLLYMLLFALLYSVAEIVILVVAISEFLLLLLGRRDNRNLRNLGQGTAIWCYCTLQFLTFNSEDKPFPFDEWPEIEENPEVVLAEESAESQTAVASDQVADEGDDVPAFTEVSDAEPEEDQPPQDKLP